MTHGPADPRWPRLLSLAVHEFRTPITVAAGYIRMILKERAGAITEQQRKLLEEAEKSCGRLSALVAEMSDLSNLEGGTAGLNRSSVDLGDLLAEAVAGLPPLQDRDISVQVEPRNGPITMQADATRLKAALGSVLMALRREIVTGDRLLVRARTADGQARVAIGEPEQVEALDGADRSSLATFDEWRGGSGLSLAIARRIISQHGGDLFGPPGDGKAAALVTLPL